MHIWQPKYARTKMELIPKSRAGPGLPKNLVLRLARHAKITGPSAAFLRPRHARTKMEPIPKSPAGLGFQQNLVQRLVRLAPTTGLSAALVRSIFLLVLLCSLETQRHVPFTSQHHMITFVYTHGSQDMREQRWSQYQSHVRVRVVGKTWFHGLHDLRQRWD